MKVLQVNKFNYLRGGADKYFLDLSQVLEQAGLKVAKFSMKHSHNLPDPNEKFFVSTVNFNRPGLHAILKAIPRMMYSWEARLKFRKLLNEFKPDIIHIHNIYHQISPSILSEAKKHNLPVIMHIHDYKLVCPNYKMFNKGKVCEKCKGGLFHMCFFTRCVKGCFIQSFLATIEMYLHHDILKIYKKNIDLYIAPSQFVKDKLVAWKVEADKIKVVPHYLDTKKFEPQYELGNYLLYFGRLDKEKGIDKLIEAMTKVKDKKLKIIGAGPDNKHLSKLINKLELTGKVELIGPKYGQELYKYIQNSYAVVVPSQWYEIFGLVNLEAAALGKLVIASNIGGIPEVIKDQQTGLLFKHDSVEDLAVKINWALRHPDQVKQIALQARQWVEKEFKLDKHLQKILDIYQNIK